MPTTPPLATQRRSSRSNSSAPNASRPRKSPTSPSENDGVSHRDAGCAGRSRGRATPVEVAVWQRQAGVPGVGDRAEERTQDDAVVVGGALAMHTVGANVGRRVAPSSSRRTSRGPCDRAATDPRSAVRRAPVFGGCVGGQVAAQMVAVSVDPLDQALGEPAAQPSEVWCIAEAAPGVQPVEQAASRHVGDSRCRRGPDHRTTRRDLPMWPGSRVAA